MKIRAFWAEVMNSAFAANPSVHRRRVIEQSSTQTIGEEVVVVVKREQTTSSETLDEQRELLESLRMRSLVGASISLNEKTAADFGRIVRSVASLHGKMDSISSTQLGGDPEIGRDLSNLEYTIEFLEKRGVEEAVEGPFKAETLVDDNAE